MYILGFDIGGTKCAVITAEYDGESISILNKEKCPTHLGISPEDMIKRLIIMADGILVRKPDAIGISCGGPLDSKKGVIMSPPNLPLWNGVEIVKILENHYGVKAFLQNDANACALAEWKFGAGKGSDNVVFLTFGTGLGAGLILGGKLYAVYGEELLYFVNGKGKIGGIEEIGGENTGRERFFGKKPMLQNVCYMDVFQLYP